MTNNSPTIKREIKVLIHRNANKNLNLKGMGPNAPQLDFGKLFNKILEEPFYLVNTKEDGSIDQNGESGSIELHVQRTKETELLLIWGIKAVTTAFLSGAATALGKRFAEWLLK